MITIINEVSGEVRTANINASQIQSQIEGHGDFRDEAVILKDYLNGDYKDSDPIAWKWNDPIEDARFLFDKAEVAAIEREDRSLIVRISVIWEEDAE